MCEATIRGMSWSDIAASAYRAYKMSNGDATPRPFEDLWGRERIAWEAAVRQAGECQARTWEEGPRDESRWAGWVPKELGGVSER